MIIMRFIVIGFIAIITACNHEEDRTPWKHEFWGEVSLDENGVSCSECQVRASKFGNPVEEGPIFIGIHHVDSDGFSTIEMGFKNLFIDITGIKHVLESEFPLGEDNHTKLTSDYITNQGHGDVTGDTYDVLESEDNWLLITEWDISSGEIKGEFQVTYVYRGLRTGVERVFPQDPDTIRITNGFFHTRIVD